MAIKQFIGLTWDENKIPQFVLRGPGENKFKLVPAQGKIKLKKGI